MLNKYIFDYRLVLEENPLFEKFVDVRDTIDNLKERYNERYYADQVNNTRKENDSESENDIIDFVHDKENMDVSLDETDAWINALRDNDNNKNIREVNLKPEYVDAPNPNYNSSVLQLLPPNRFLLPGSGTWQGEHTFYKFTGSDTHNNNPYDYNRYVCLIQKHRFSKKDHFIRLQKAMYRFDRKRNVTSELKKHLIIWTYNTKTKQLYKIKKVKNDRFKKGSHFHNSIQKAFNTLSSNSYSWSDISIRITNKFINTILEAAKKDVPDLVLLDEKSIKPTPSTFITSESYKVVIDVEEMKMQTFRKMSLAAIILQHRVGQPIKWLNYNLIQNIWAVLGDLQFQEKIIFGSHGNYNRTLAEVKSQSKAMRKKTIYQLVPNLRKSNHMKTAIKTILGKGYSKFFIKLLNTNRMGDMFLSEWLHATNKDLISKNLYHWVAQTINTNNSSDVVTDMINNVNRILNLMLRNQNELNAHDSDFDSDQFFIILDSYIKMYKKIVTIDVALPRWDTWYDIYNMASQLGIRVRPNKLNSNNGIRHLHDKLAEIINRDRVTIKKYRNSIFEEFISPDKKYDGFEFIQMRTAQDLVDEGTTMRHCVGSYADRCANGRSIIFSMRKNGKGYVTIELNTITYKVSQQYTLHDITVTSRGALNIIDRWNSDCIELHKDDKESYHGICQRKVKEYTEREKAKNLKELVKNGIVDSESQILSGYLPKNEETAHAAAI